MKSCDSPSGAACISVNFLERGLLATVSSLRLSLSSVKMRDAPGPRWRRETLGPGTCSCALARVLPRLTITSALIESPQKVAHHSPGSLPKTGPALICTPGRRQTALIRQGGETEGHHERHLGTARGELRYRGTHGRRSAGVSAQTRQSDRAETALGPRLRALHGLLLPILVAAYGPVRPVHVRHSQSWLEPARSPESAEYTHLRQGLRDHTQDHWPKLR